MAASGLLIGLFALAAVQDAPPAENPYSAREVFAAFTTVCSGFENKAVAKASALAAANIPLPGLVLTATAMEFLKP